MFSSSLDTVRLHDCFGLPLLLLPWGFHSMAIRVVLFGAFLRVWPIHFHFLRFIDWIYVVDFITLSFRDTILISYYRYLSRAELREAGQGTKQANLGEMPKLLRYVILGRMGWWGMSNAGIFRRRSLYHTPENTVPPYRQGCYITEMCNWGGVKPSGPWCKPETYFSVCRYLFKTRDVKNSPSCSSYLYDRRWMCSLREKKFVFSDPCLHYKDVLMRRSIRKFNIPPPGNPPGIWTFEDWLVQIPSRRGKKPVQMPHQLVLNYLSSKTDFVFNQTLYTPSRER